MLVTGPGAGRPVPAGPGRWVVFMPALPRSTGRGGAFFRRGGWTRRSARRPRSEERRGGEEWRFRWAADHLKKKKKKLTSEHRHNRRNSHREQMMLPAASDSNITHRYNGGCYACQVDLLLRCVATHIDGSVQAD